MPDQIQAGFYAPSQIAGLAHAMHVHVIDTRFVPKEVVVKGGDFDSIVQESRHDRIYLVLEQH